MAKFYGGTPYLRNKELKYYALAAGLVVLHLFLAWLAIKTVPPGLWLIGILFLLILFAVKLSQPLVRLFRRRSSSYSHGRGGEADIRKELAQLPDEYSVFCDVRLDPNKGNLDFVVVGPGGVFLLEAKSHAGFVGLNGSNLTFNGRNFRDKDFFNQVHGQTWALKNYLKQKTGTDIYIKAVLVFSNPRATMNFGFQPVSNIYIIRKRDLLYFLSTFPGDRYPVDRGAIEQALK